MNIEIQSQDVVRLILQFLKENNLSDSFATLQREANVALNTVENMKTLLSHVRHGRWDYVLDMVPASLSGPLAYELYEHIVIELAELGDTDTGRALLKTSPALSDMKNTDLNRYRRLERILGQPHFTASEAYPGKETKSSRRNAIANQLEAELATVQPSRLLSLITQAVKWQQHQGLLPSGSQIDLFRNASVTSVSHAVEKLPVRNDRLIKVGKMNHAECVGFSRDGQFMVIGTLDGFVEVYDSETGKLRTDLQYQADEQLMMHDDAVLCLDFSRDGELLATGSKNGQVKVWRIKTGACVKRFPSAHTKGVTCVQFARDSTQVLTGSFDTTLRVHGLRSGKTLKDYRGHKSYVNAAIYNDDCTRIYSGGSDGAICVWDAKSTDCLFTWRPYSNDSGVEAPILQLCWVPSTRDQLVVTGRASEVLVLSVLNGNIVKRFSHNKKTIDFLCTIMSTKGRYLYSAGSDSLLYMFDTSSGDMVHVIKIHNSEVLGLAHHPFLNTLASYSSDSTVKLWKP